MTTVASLLSNYKHIWQPSSEFTDALRSTGELAEVLESMAAVRVTLESMADVSRAIALWPSSPRVIVRRPEPERQQIAPTDWEALVKQAVALAGVINVRKHVQELDTRRSRKPSLDKLKEAYDTYNDMKGRGKSARQIAGKLHMSVATLYRWLDDYKVHTGNNENP